MKKIYLLSSALSLIWTVSADNASAVCVQTPTCSAMGYESSKSCTGGLKCPWGNYWNCTNSNKITELTNKITNLETQITEIRKEVSTANCLVGDILYSDMTINADYVSNKTPIGVVFDCRKKLAIGLQESKEYWSYPDSFDVPGVDNIVDSITDHALVMTDLDGKKNTSTILAYCKTKRKSCPAFEYVSSYKTEGTQAGDWYLPAEGELYAIYGNMGVLNVALGKIAAARLGANYYWSSSEHSSNHAWRLYLYSGDVNDYGKYNYDYVRPVLAF